MSGTPHPTFREIRESPLQGFISHPTIWEDVIIILCAISFFVGMSLSLAVGAIHESPDIITPKCAIGTIHATQLQFIAL